MIIEKLSIGELQEWVRSHTTKMKKDFLVDNDIVLAKDEHYEFLEDTYDVVVYDDNGDGYILTYAQFDEYCNL